jgi:chromosomal replication initiator protein
MHLIWDEFLKIIKEEAGSQVVETWFKAVCLDEWNIASQTVTLRVPNQFVSRWIQDHYTELLKIHLARLLNTTTLKIIFISSQEPTRTRNIIPASVIHQTTAPEKDFSKQPQNSLRTPVIITPRSEELVVSDKKSKEKVGNAINPAYQFDNFVVGASNSLAHAAAYAVCENLGKVYNPLFIYGGTGLGKTHLMHAIGNEVKKRNPELIVRYETSDNFVNDFINSIRFDRAQQFRSRYQKVDVILFDDIQFLSNKEQTQETFFHIFNIFYEQQKQIVLSSDTFPKEIQGLQSRLKSRMEWGLVADIQTPDIETKMAILKKKAELHSLDLPDDVAEFIASRVISSIRELEGSLVRVSAFASLTNQVINVEMAKKVLLTLNSPKKEGIMLETVMKVVAKHYDVSVNDIRSKKRHQDIASIRQIAFYMMKKMSFYSLQAIGSFVGGRDHSTVIHAITKVESLLAKDGTLHKKLKILENDILSSQ